MAKRSEVWNHFIRNLEEAKCRICQKTISCKGGSTTGLRNHLMVHDIQPCKIQNVDPIPKRHAAQNSITLFSKKETLDEVIARLAAEDGFSYSKICQSKFIRSALRDKGFTPIRDHKTVSQIVIRYAKIAKEKMTSQLQALLLNDERLSVTLDEYTSIQNKRYMNVNIHSANKFWNLGMARIYGRMPAEKVLENLIEKLKEFKIDLHQHIVSIVCDGAPVMVKMGKLSCIHQQTCLVHGVHLAVVAVLYSKSPTPIFIQGIDENVSDESEDDSMASNLFIDFDSIDDDSEDDEVIEDALIPPFRMDIHTVVTKVRNVVRIFRKSPLKNEILQSYVEKLLGKKLNLILDCKTRWNSLIKMIDRFFKLRKPLCKAMIDVNSKLDLKEQEWQALESISACLKPIEMGISALCQRDSNLLAAEGIFQFMFNQLEIIDSEFALELLQHLKRNYHGRRQTDIVNLMRYFLDPSCIQDLGITKKEVHKTMKQILIQLYSHCDSTEAEVNDSSNTQEIGNNNEVESNLSQSESLRKQLEDSIKLSTSLVIHQKQEVGFPSLNKEMALFEANGNKSKYLNLVDRALRTIPPTSVEAERAFSAAGLFVTKLRARLSEKSIDSLMVLKFYFKYMDVLL